MRATSATVGFNPTRVRLKPRPEHAGLLGRHRFNPTRVRLKRIVRRFPQVESRGLQPHEGSSETGIDVDGANSLIELQPHEGSSETIRYGISKPSRPVLQPHEGSSETRPPQPGAGLVDMALQPHEGSSETDSMSKSGTDDRLASTPRGFV